MKRFTWKPAKTLFNWHYWCCFDKKMQVQIGEIWPLKLAGGFWWGLCDQRTHFPLEDISGVAENMELAKRRIIDGHKRRIKSFESERRDP